MWRLYLSMHHKHFDLQTLRTLVSAGLIAAGGAVAQAGMVSVGPFAGDWSETWESFTGYVQPAGPTSIMGGHATFSHTGLAISTVGNIQLSMYQSGIVVPSDGIRSAGLISNPSLGTIVFSSDVFAFGGYWGVPTSKESAWLALAPDPGGLEFSFWDPSGAPIDSSMVSYSHTSNGDGKLDWHGWSSTVAIGSVKFRNKTGYQVMMDGLQASTHKPTVPEAGVTGPLLVGSMILLGLGRKVP